MQSAVYSVRGLVFSVLHFKSHKQLLGLSVLDLLESLKHIYLFRVFMFVCGKNDIFIKARIIAYLIVSCIS